MPEKQKTEIFVGICDDEPMILEKLREKCTEILGGTYRLSISTADCARQMRAMTEPFQIALLDVQLPGDDGITLARDLLSRNPGCRIIFVSGFLNAVSEVYQVPHFCFILKDQLDRQLPRFLRRAADAVAEEAGEQLTVLIGRNTEQIPFSRIVCFERRGHTTYITLADGQSLQTSEKLPDLMQRIHHSHFVRSHISYIVNLIHVQRIEDSGFKMKDGQWVPISRPNLQTCRDAFFASLECSF